MCSNKITKKIFCHALSARKTPKFGRSHKLFFREYLSNSGGMPNMTSLSDWVVSFLPYQFCTTIYYQRHKWYIVQDYSNLNPLSLSRLFVTSDSEKGDPVRESGGRLGRLDAVNESGMFHKINKAKLEKIKKTLKEKGDEDEPSKEPTPDPANPAAK